MLARYGGNVNPDLVFMVEISDELIVFVALTSNLKFKPVAVCPERSSVGGACNPRAAWEAPFGEAGTQEWVALNSVRLLVR